ncbi:MAG: hypothetical protein QOF77_1712 [Solirubrobacteraceae bacterium]|nr:hypothetical protein [Solirubrobacteraceae bacterium]
MAAAAAAGLWLAGCGSGARPAPFPPAAAHQPAPPRPRGRRIGATQRIRARGATIAVTVARVFDPLRGSGVALPPGTRAVGVVVGIRNLGPGVYDSSSTGDLSIAASAGTASAAAASRGPCKTEDRDFDNQIAPATTRTGCVVFALDAAARLDAVRFAADAGGAGKASWEGPRRTT